MSLMSSTTKGKPSKFSVSGGTKVKSVKNLICIAHVQQQGNFSVLALGDRKSHKHCKNPSCSAA